MPQPTSAHCYTLLLSACCWRGPFLQAISGATIHYTSGPADCYTLLLSGIETALDRARRLLLSLVLSGSSWSGQRAVL